MFFITCTGNDFSVCSGQLDIELKFQGLVSSSLLVQAMTSVFVVDNWTLN